MDQKITNNTWPSTWIFTNLDHINSCKTSHGLVSRLNPRRLVGLQISRYNKTGRAMHWKRPQTPHIVTNQKAWMLNKPWIILDLRDFNSTCSTLNLSEWKLNKTAPYYWPWMLLNKVCVTLDLMNFSKHWSTLDHWTGTLNNGILLHQKEPWKTCSRMNHEL